jgi:putative membrane protein
MRYLRYMVLGFIAISLIVVALANRGAVNLSLLPEALGALVGFNVQMQVPLFVVIFLGVTLGLLIGFVWEWPRNEHIQVVRLERQVSKLKATSADTDEDEILALLDEVS